MPETYTQFKTRLWEAAGECCEICNAYVPRDKVQLHHVLHQAQHPHLVMDEDDVVITCPGCHDLDWSGGIRALDVFDKEQPKYTKLRRMLIRIKGQEWYERLISKREVHRG